MCMYATRHSRYDLCQYEGLLPPIAHLPYKWASDDVVGKESRAQAQLQL